MTTVACPTNTNAPIYMVNTHALRAVADLLDIRPDLGPIARIDADQLMTAIELDERCPQMSDYLTRWANLFPQADIRTMTVPEDGEVPSYTRVSVFGVQPVIGYMVIRADFSDPDARDLIEHTAPADLLAALALTGQ